MNRIIDTIIYQPVELKFGTSGLRGLVSDMTDLECYINTRGFLSFISENDKSIKNNTVIIAGDLRESTPRIMSAVAHKQTISTINPWKINGHS